MNKGHAVMGKGALHGFKTGSTVMGRQGQSKFLNQQASVPEILHNPQPAGISKGFMKKGYAKKKF